MPFKIQLVKRISSGRNWFKTKIEIVDSLFCYKKQIRTLIKGADFVLFQKFVYFAFPTKISASMVISVSWLQSISAWSM